MTRGPQRPLSRRCCANNLVSRKKMRAGIAWVRSSSVQAHIAKRTQIGRTAGKGITRSPAKIRTLEWLRFWGTVMISHLMR